MHCNNQHAGPISVLVVDDDADVRFTLCAAIRGERDLVLAGEAGSAEAAVRAATELQPNVLVLDLQLPDGHGWAVLEQLRTAGALPPTLVLSGCDEQVFARRILRAGASGYLMKNAGTDAILRAIREVGSGRLVASGPVTTDLMAEALGHPAAPAAAGAAGVLAGLSDREILVWSLLQQNLRIKEIAGRLNLSEKTVSTYKARLRSKLPAS